MELYYPKPGNGQQPDQQFLILLVASLSPVRSISLLSLDTCRNSFDEASLILLFQWLISGLRARR